MQFFKNLSNMKWSNIFFMLLGVVITVTYQNCNSGLMSQRTTNSSSNNELTQSMTEGEGCLPELRSWQSGSTVCTAETPGMAEGAEQLVIDNSNPTTGQATFRCVLNNGAFQLQLSTQFPNFCNMQQNNNRTNGDCGTLDNTTVAAVTQPTQQQLCTAGTPSLVTGNGPWNWSCVGVGEGSTTEQCEAFKSGGTGPTATAGDCGSAHGQTLSSVPTTGLCDAGTPNPATPSGSGPWYWVCNGLNGGSNSGTCQANKQNSGSGGGGEVPRCGAATVGSSGPSSLSEFTANDYCFTGTSTHTTPVGTGPWAWYCKNPSTNQQSEECRSIFPSTESCPGGATGVRAGTKQCTTRYGESKVCGACVPTSCTTGYQLSGSPARCEPLFTGSCTIPAGTVTIQNQNTHMTRTCETSIAAAQNFTVGQSISPIVCTNQYGMRASMALRCVQSTYTDAENNGGAPYSIKRLEYYSGIGTYYDGQGVKQGGWGTATFSGAFNIAETVTYNTQCRSNPDITTSVDGVGIRILGPVSSNAARVSLARCLTTEEGELYLVEMECDGIPAYNDTFATWVPKKATRATPDGSARCKTIPPAGTTTVLRAFYVDWGPPSTQ